MSAMSVSRAVQDLQELELLNVRKEGTSKLVKSVTTGIVHSPEEPADAGSIRKGDRAAERDGV